jgi:hypothetical protein
VYLADNVLGHNGFLSAACRCASSMLIRFLARGIGLAR